MAEFRPARPVRNGLELLTKAQAGKCTIEFTRIATGCGVYAEDEDFSQAEALKEERQTFALVGKKIVNERTVLVKSLVTNQDYDGDGYSINEVGLYAMDPDKGEILYMMAVALPGRGDYMPAFNGMFPCEWVNDFYAEVSAAADVTIMATPGAVALAEDLEALEKRVEKLEENAGAATVLIVTIPSEGWTLETTEDMGMDEYPLRVDVPCGAAQQVHVPMVTLHKQSLNPASYAGLCPTAESTDGALRFWAKRQPYMDMQATVALIPPGGAGGGGASMPIAGQDTPGAVMVKPGSGLQVDGEGNLSIKAATEQDFADILA